MRKAIIGAVVGIMILTTPLSARAVAIRMIPVPDRVAHADTIITGKVTRIENKKVSVTISPDSKEKQDYLVAVIKIEDAIKGGKDVTDIKVGFLAPAPAGEGRPLIRPGGLRARVELKEDQEVLLFLRPHHSGEFLVLEGLFDVVDKKNGTYEEDVKKAKNCVKLLDDPVKGLKSKEATDRLLTASLLVSQYRNPRIQQGAKEEEIDAEQSKLILKALAEADWEAKSGPGPFSNQLMPQNVFNQFNLTEKDGWKQVQDYTKFNALAKAWCNDNAEKYRIKKFVAKEEKKDKKKGK